MNERELRLKEPEKKLARQAADEFIRWSISTIGTNNPHTRHNAWKSEAQRLWEMTMAYGAEIGVARKLNMVWNGVGTGKRQADVGNNIEVRWTSGQNLVVRANDREKDIAFLCKGTTLENLYIVGFMPIKMARVAEYKLPTEEVWMVPLPKLYTYMPNNGTVKRFIEQYSRLI
jgi:hypothetical protein